MHYAPHPRRRSLLLGGTLALALGPGGAERPVAIGGAGASAATGNEGGEAAVSIDNFTFVPPVLTVVAGTRVVWTNRDDIPHTVVGTDDPQRLRSPPLDTDETFPFTFGTPGQYRYFCSLHPHMQGTVIVR